MRKTRLALFGALALASSFVPAAAAHAQAGLPPCLNYKISEPYGAVSADTRPVGADPIGNVSWLWQVTPVSEREGYYAWQTLINGKPAVNGGGGELKDDAAHSTTPHYHNGNLANYTYGDTWHLEAVHEGPDGHTLYETPDNMCYIAAH